MNRNALAVSLTALISTTAFAMPPRGAQPMRAATTTAEGATPNAVVQGCNTPKLSYGNGPLIQKVKIYDVFYSPGNPFEDMLGAFYTAITQSAYFDWLVEYNSPDGKYKISRGSYLGKFEDTNPATTATIPDTGATGSVQAYLKALIAANKVPKPDNDTIYMIYFPSQVTIKLGTDSSCSTFCAYHSSMTVNNQLVRYGVMPDVTAGACAMGCGPNTGFLNVTDVSSHELIEAVTDPDNGTGWYDTVDQNCGEIGDICATNAGETGVVATYTVQKEWSNAANDCIVMSPNQFDAAASPATLNIAPGGMATASITLTKKAGMAEMTTLTATGIMGLTASLAPTSATSDNGMTTLTVSVPASAAPGTMGKVTVAAAGKTSSATVDVNVLVVGPPDMAQPVESGNNGGNGGNGSGGSGGNGGGNQLHGSSSGCSVGGAGIGGAWAVTAFLLLALAFRRRNA